MNIRHRNPNRGTVSAGEIITAYTEAFNIPWWRLLLSTLATALGIGGIFQLADASYGEMTDEEELRLYGFLEQDKTNLEHYVAEDFDCDDFTFRLFGALHTDLAFAAMPIYITWVSWEITGNWFKRVWTRIKWFVTGQTAGHAVLSYYKASKVRYIEPQNDIIKPIPEDWQLRLLCG